MPQAHTYSKRTLRKMRPLQRKVALEVNQLEAAARRLRKVVDQLGEVEVDAAAQRKEREELAEFVANDMSFEESRQCIAHGHYDYTADGIPVCSVDFSGQTSVVAVLEMAVAP